MLTLFKMELFLLKREWQELLVKTLGGEKKMKREAFVFGEDWLGNRFGIFVREEIPEQSQTVAAPVQVPAPAPAKKSNKLLTSLVAVISMLIGGGTTLTITQTAKKAQKAFKVVVVKAPVVKKVWQVVYVKPPRQWQVVHVLQAPAPKPAPRFVIEEVVPKPTLLKVKFDRKQKVVRFRIGERMVEVSLEEKRQRRVTRRIRTRRPAHQNACPRPTVLVKTGR